MQIALTPMRNVLKQQYPVVVEKATRGHHSNLNVQ